MQSAQVAGDGGSSQSLQVVGGGGSSQSMLVPGGATATGASAAVAVADKTADQMLDETAGEPQQG
jgi:hypothetical protein